MKIAFGVKEQVENVEQAEVHPDFEQCSVFAVIDLNTHESKYVTTEQLQNESKDEKIHGVVIGNLNVESLQFFATKNIPVFAGFAGKVKDVLSKFKAEFTPPLRIDQDWFALNDQQLIYAHFEIHRAWGVFKRTNKWTDQTGHSWSQEDFFNQHMLIVEEMERRGFEHHIRDELDRITLTKLALKFDIENYDPKKPNDKQLLDDHRLAHAWATNVMNGIEMPWELNEIKEFHDKVAQEMIARGFDHKSELTLEYGEPLPSGIIEGDEITLEEVLKYVKPFKVAQDIALITGGIVNHGRTKGDIDILIRTLSDDPINIPLMFRIYRLFPEHLRKRIQFLHEDTTRKQHVPGAYTSHIPVWSLEAVVNEPLRRVSMQKMQQRIVLGKYFTPLKPTIGYRIGEVYGFDALREVVTEEMYPCILEKKYNGARIQLHKDHDDVVIYSDDGEVITHRLPSFVQELKKPEWPDEVILDAEAEIWLNGRHQSREITSGFLRQTEKLFPGEDKHLVVNVFDILWYDAKGDLHLLPLEERLKIRDTLPIQQSTDEVPKTGVFNRTPAYVVRNDEELVETGKRVAELPNSEGVMVKSLQSIYELDGESKFWFKYKKTATFRVVVVEKYETRTPNVFNYHMGFRPHRDFKVAPEDIRVIRGEQYVYVGKTLNTSFDVPIGTTLRVSAENLFVYPDRMRLYVTVVLEPKPDDPVDDVITAQRIAKEAGLLIEKELQVPFWPKERDEPYRGVVQHHYRGKGAHTDFRVEVNDRLEGWTIFSMPVGEIPKTPENLREAEEIAKNVDWKWPRTDFHAQCTEKSQQPKIWLDVEGWFDPGEVGAGVEVPGFMQIVDKPKIEFGTRKPYFYEYFYDGKLFKGRLIFRFIPRVEERELGFWNTWIPEDQTPYVLGESAVKDGWIPPQGISALPKEIRDKIPEKFQFWKHRDKRTRIQIRDELVKAELLKFKVIEVLEEDKYLLCRYNQLFMGTGAKEKFTEGDIVKYSQFERIVKVHQEIKDFVLMHHWWRGPFVIRFGPTVEHWDLFIDGTQIVMDRNPLKVRSNAIVRKPYSPDFWKKGREEAEYIKPGSPGNPTKETDCWVQALDWGQVSVLEDGELFKRWNFRGKTLKGTYVMRRENAHINLWVFEKAELPGEIRRRQEQLQKNELIRSSKINLSINNFQLQGEKLIVTGDALSFGVWNGDYYPQEVIADRPERIVGIPVGIDSHEDPHNIGKVVGYELERDTYSIHIEAEVEDPNAIKKIQEDDYVGFSVEVVVIADEQRHIIKKILSYERVIICKDPACEVCTIENIERVTRADSCRTMRDFSKP